MKKQKKHIYGLVTAGIILTTVVIIAFVWYRKTTDSRREAAFAPVNCPNPPYTPDADAYQGALIDTHIHIPHIPENPFDNSTTDKNDKPLMGKNITVTDYVCMMKHENTKKVFAFFPVWDPITNESIEIVRRTMKEYPDNFVPFLMPPDKDDDPNGFPTVNATTLENMLALEPDLFFGYGEIGLYARNAGAAALPPDSSRLQEIYPIVHKNKLTVYFHLGEGQKENFERVLDANPDINFIWHGDQLITRDEQGNEQLEQVADILENHPNAYYGVDELYGGVWILKPEVSKQEFLAHFNDPEPLLKRDVEQWKNFIEKHQDQVLWGTDRGWSSGWSTDTDVAKTLNNYSRRFIGRLDPVVQEKFAYQNAEKLLTDKR